MSFDQEESKQEKIGRIIEFCNLVKIRVTYGAVAGILGIIPRGMSNYLGEKRAEVSWVVNKKSKKPTKYHPDQYHEELFKYSYVISKPQELLKAIGNRDYKPPRA